MIESIFQQFRNSLRRSVKHRPGKFSSRFDTSDVVQESLIQLWMKVSITDPEKLDIQESYLRRVGRGTASKMRRYHRAEKRDALCEANLASENFPANHSSRSAMEDARQEEQLELMRIVAELGYEEQFVVYRKYFDKCTLAEIAHELDVTIDTVRGRLRRAFRSIECRMATNSGE